MSARSMAAPSRPTGDQLPPVDFLSVLALALVVIGGVIMASYVPRHVPLALPLALLAGAVIAMVIAGVLLFRISGFAWDKFTLVFKWALLAYTISAGMIEFAFVRDHTRGSALVVVTAMLVIFATSVPTTIAYTVARYANGLPAEA